MRRNRTLVFIVGVALFGVTPIFSLANAQGSSQSRMLLEMQQMRQEIAELRDMVERQQYQLRKLQQAQSRQPSRQGSGNYADTDPRSNQPAQPNYDGGSPQRGDDQNSQGAYQQPGYDGSQADAADPSLGQPYDPRETAGSNPFPNQSPTNNRSGDGVEERVITAPRFPNERGVDFPPVVDRSIGGQSNESANPDGQELLNQGQDEVNQGREEAQRPTWQSTNPSRVLNTPAPQDTGSENAVPTARSGARSGGVIAVPQGLPQRQTTPQTNSSDRVVNSDTASTAGIPSRLSESDYYKQGFDLMKKSEFEQAVAVFEQQLKAYPAGDSADDAHYWIAEAMYVSRNLDVAKKHLKQLVEEFPQSRRVPDAMLKTAYIEQQQGNQIEARILFQEIVNYFPKSDAAIAARNRLEDSN